MEHSFLPLEPSLGPFSHLSHGGVQASAYGLAADASRPAVILDAKDVVATSASWPWSQSAILQNGGPARVNGVTFPVFRSADFVNLLKGPDAGSWRRMRQGAYVGGDNGGYTEFFEDPNGSVFQRLQRTGPGGDSGFWDEWVHQSPFGISRDAMQRHFRAGDRGDVMAGPSNQWTDTNYWPEFDANGNLTGLTIKTDKREGTFVPYVKAGDGSFVPSPERAALRPYVTNNGDQWRDIYQLVKWARKFIDAMNGWFVSAA